MTTLSNYLSLILYSSGSADQSGSFLTWTQNMSGSVNSNMTKIDNWSGSASGSISRLSGSASASATLISGSITNISGSLTTLLSTATTLGLRFTKLAEFTGAGQANFNNISGSYTHLLLIGVAAGTGASTYRMDVGIDFNGDANSANYATLQWDYMRGPSDIETFGTDTLGSIQIGTIPGQLSATGYGAPFLAIIPNYSGSSGLYKTAMGIGAWAKLSTPSAYGAATSIQGGTWINSSAITRVRVFALYASSSRYNFVAGTKISLYGIG